MCNIQQQNNAESLVFRHALWVKRSKGMLSAEFIIIIFIVLSCVRPAFRNRETSIISPTCFTQESSSTKSPPDEKFIRQPRHPLYWTPKAVLRKLRIFIIIFTSQLPVVILLELNFNLLISYKLTEYFGTVI